jgi:hypothetical protein
MEKIRAMAVLSVRRGCAFAGLAIGTVMFGLASDPLLSLRSGAVLTTLAAVILFWKALQAPTRNYRHTELWVMLERTPDMLERHAGHLVNGILHEVYLGHAEAAAAIAWGLWLIAIALQILG